MKKLKKLHMNFLVWAFWESVFSKIALAGASCDYQKCKLLAVAGVVGFWVAKLQVRQVKKGHKSYFGVILINQRQWRQQLIVQDGT